MERFATVLKWVSGVSVQVPGLRKTAKLESYKAGKLEGQEAGKLNYLEDFQPHSLQASQPPGLCAISYELFA